MIVGKDSLVFFFLLLAANITRNFISIIRFYLFIIVIVVYCFSGEDVFMQFITSKEEQDKPDEDVLDKLKSKSIIFIYFCMYMILVLEDFQIFLN